MKSFAHGSFSVYLILAGTEPGRLTDNTKKLISDLQKELKDAKTLLSLEYVSKQQRLLIDKLVHLTNAFIDKIFKQNEWNIEGLENYYVSIKPIVLDLVTNAAQDEIDALSAAIDPWLAQMTPQEKSKLGIVVATAHQARAKEISVQYFAKRFNKKVGEGAMYEDGLVVMEDKFDEKSALILLARHYLDRQAAQIIFQEPNRLQYDILGSIQILPSKI